MSDTPRQQSPALGVRAIRPAPDEDSDPIVTVQPSTQRAQEGQSIIQRKIETAKGRRMTHRPPATVTIQMNTRISITTRALLESICDRDGINMRMALEQAIEAYAK